MHTLRTIREQSRSRSYAPVRKYQDIFDEIHEAYNRNKYVQLKDYVGSHDPALIEGIRQRYSNEFATAVEEALQERDLYRKAHYNTYVRELKNKDLKPGEFKASIILAHDYARATNQIDALLALEDKSDAVEMKHALDTLDMLDATKTFEHMTETDIKTEMQQIIHVLDKFDDKLNESEKTKLLNTLGALQVRLEVHEPYRTKVHSILHGMDNLHV